MGKKNKKKKDRRIKVKNHPEQTEVEPDESCDSHESGNAAACPTLSLAEMSPAAPTRAARDKDSAAPAAQNGDKRSTSPSETNEVDIKPAGLDNAPSATTAVSIASSLSEAVTAEQRRAARKKKRNRKKNKSMQKENSIVGSSERPNKKQKIADTQTEKGESLASTATTILTTPEFPFPIDSDDHCETPKEAYMDILPFLQMIQDERRAHSSSDSSLRIYDPYYCNGAVQRNFHELGYPVVYNERENCYDLWESATRYPDFDVLITNPPYSGDHMEKLLQHLTSSLSLFGKEQRRPWFLLLPNWVHKKDFFVEAMTRAGISPFFLVPRKRYVYVPPKDFRRAKKSDVHKKSSPWHSMWYIWAGTTAQTELWIRRYTKIQMAGAMPSSCDLARNKNALRDLRRKQKR